MKKINFLFAIHCHQPVGNFEYVIEDAYQKSYLPFIEVLEKFPGIKMTIHYTGVLLEYLRKKHPEFIKKLNKMAAKGQIEIMTGAFNEPIMPIIPDCDKAGQIKKQTDFIKKHLGQDPRGMWLAERVWEPHLAMPLNHAKVEYTLLDDYHFISAGLEEKDLFGYYTTEEQGHELKVFPISKTLRYLMPFKLPRETIDYLGTVATESGCNAAIIGDDGEKFGVWPGTHKWVYEEKWLENFFSALDEHKAWIETRTFSQYMDTHKAESIIYLPAASYYEMMEWSLLAAAGKKFYHISEEMRRAGKLEDYKQFFKGGFFRNFFVKYSESNNMHKKMLLVSKKAQKTTVEGSSEKEMMLNELWMGQCNCPYWHGVFGGLYLNYLRHAIYEHLIKAENIADKFSHGSSDWLEAETRDLLKEGRKEILVSSRLLNLYFSEIGGSAFELDYRPKAFNLMNTLTRREEAYHKDVLRSHSHQLTITGTTNVTSSIHDMVRVKEVGLEKYLNYDWYRRSSFIDHFLDPDTNIERFAACKYGEAGDFVLSPYEHEILYGRDDVKIVLKRRGKVRFNASYRSVEIQKTFTLYADRPEVDAAWQVKNLSDEKISLWMGIELNLSLLAGSSPDRYYVIDGKKPSESSLGSTGISQGIYEVGLIDKWSGISIMIDGSKRFDLWRFPIETVSQSEAGFERVYQNSVLLLSNKFDLEKGAVESFSIKMMIEEGDHDA
ncbi:MAG: alpha-amylase/4-alpha-glucanotransferase domain-containing protein [Candidatus Margulisiibacteriota bacterium]